MQMEASRIQRGRPRALAGVAQRSEMVSELVKQTVRAYGAYLRTVLVHDGVHECDADDVLQEVWEIFGVCANRLSGDPRAWLIRVARNRAGNYYQERRTAKQYPLVELEDDAPDPRPDAEQWLIWDDLVQLVDELEPELGEVIKACMAGETIEEMSERLRIPEGTCSSRLRRARVRLQAALARRDGLRGT
jgi:RNA polymerase sigma factor (sigma-70 family)